MEEKPAPFTKTVESAAPAEFEPSFSPSHASDMLWPLRATHVHTSAIGKTRPRPWPHGVRGAEHERDGRDWAVHRDTAGHSGDGRAAVFAGMVGGRNTLAGGRPGVGRARRGDAARRRHVRISARGLRSGARRALDVFPVHLADADSGAAGSRFWRDWFLAIPHLPGPARQVPTESGFRRAGRFPDRAALPQDRGRRPDLEVSLDRRGRHNAMDDLGRGDTLLRADGV